VSPTRARDQLVDAFTYRYLEVVTSPQRLDGSTDRRRYAYQRFESVELLDAVDEEDDSEVEDVWHVQLEPGDVRQLSLEQLDDFYRFGIINDQTYLWKKGYSAWKRLATVLEEHPPEQDPDSEEVFHVLMEDRSKRILTLEQVDDFYRIGLIDEKTLLWQPGQNEWQTLAMLAGLDAVPQGGQSHQGQYRESNLPTTRYNAAPTAIHHVSPQAQPAAVQPRPAAVQPRPATVQPRPATVQLVQPDFPSAPPVALSYAPRATSTTNSGARWLLRLSFAAAMFLVLGRNDAFYAIAANVKQGPSYLDTERRTLGGPSFGTTRAVEKLIAESGGALEPVRVPVVVAHLTSKPEPKTISTQSIAPVTPQKSPNEPIPPSTAKAASESKTTSMLSSNVADALGGATKKPSKAATAKPVAVPRTKKSNKGSAQFSSGKANYYDPLNGAL
jgi:hypothetical protein